MAKMDIAQLSKLLEEANGAAEFKKAVKADAERAKSKLEAALVAVEDLLTTLNSDTVVKKERKPRAEGAKKPGRPKKEVAAE